MGKAARKNDYAPAFQAALRYPALVRESITPKILLETAGPELEALAQNAHMREAARISAEILSAATAPVAPQVCEVPACIAGPAHPAYKAKSRPRTLDR